MATRPSMDVYYNQGPAEYQKQLALYEYEQGDTSAAWNDPVYGHRKVVDYLKDIQNPVYKTTPAPAQTPVGQAANDFTTIQNGVLVPSNGTQTRLTTPQFAEQFQAQQGRAPTQQELLGYVNTRAFPSAPSATQAVPDPLAGYRGGDAQTSSIVDYLSSAGKPSDFNSRATLAGQAGIQNYTGTAAQNTQLLNVLRGKQPSSDITVKSFESAKPVQLPGISGVDIGATSAAVAAGAAQYANSLQAYIDRNTLPPTATEQKAQTLTDQLAALVGESTGRGAEQLAAEQKAGIPELNTQLSSIIAQIQAKRAEFEAFKLAQEGKPITLSSISGSIAQQQGKIASDILLLQAQGDILQGQLSSAQANVDRAIDLKYQDIDNRYKIYSAQLEALKPILDREERTRALALEQMNNDRQMALADKKAEEKNIQGIMLSAIEAGITDQNVLNRISNAKSSREALQIAGPIIGGFAQEERELGTAYKRAQIANIQSEIAKRGRSVEQEYDPADILAYAQQYASTGQIPTGLPKNSFGLVSQVAKEIPKQTGTLVNSITGIKDSKLGTAEEGDLTRLYNITENAKKLVELDKKRIGGVVAGTLGKIFGSDAQAEYLTKRKAIVDDIQRMQSGAALTETEQSFYKDYLPGRFSESFFLGQDSGKKIQNFASEMNTKLENALKTNNLSIYGYSEVKIGDQTYKVGDIVSNGEQSARVNPDGTLTLIQ